MTCGENLLLLESLNWDQMQTLWNKNALCFYWSWKVFYWVCTDWRPQHKYQLHTDQGWQDLARSHDPVARITPWRFECFNPLHHVTKLLIANTGHPLFWIIEQRLERNYKDNSNVIRSLSSVYAWQQLLQPQKYSRKKTCSLVIGRELVALLPLILILA